MSHWQLAEADNIATLSLDVAGQSVNVLSRAVLQELDRLLIDLENRPLRGLIVGSGKASGFIAGADITEFENISDSARAAELARAGQQVFNRLAALKFPSVAVIHGFCLGGGLELALACSFRIARDDEGTRLGLPEVKLGIHPGFAGTVRLPSLVGALPALDLMLTGRTVSSRQARRLGLVDKTVPERHLLHAARAFIGKPRERKPVSWSRRAPGAPLLRPLFHALLLHRLRKKVSRDHYPAPYRILELWRQAASQEQEATSLGELLVGSRSRNLVRVFLLGEELKRKGRQHVHLIERVHVIGAGVMGGDIAAWAAFKGFNVSLQDRDGAILARAVKRAHALFSKKLKHPRAIQEAMDRLMPDLRGSGLHCADIVIEAIVEKAEAKQGLFRAIEHSIPAHAVLATNTSSIPLEVLAQSLDDPARLVGLHFFNPVAKMQLVEVVRGAQSSEEALARARAFTVALERLPLDVRSSPGFLVNRILMPYLIEAILMAEEGVPLADIDAAATRFGMPMGPIHLADTVGLDICLSVAELLSEPLRIPVPGRLRAMVEQKHLGKKSGWGFYKYGNAGTPKRRRPSRRIDAQTTDRLILRLLNEAMASLREGVVADAGAVDAGMVYGTGFAPFLGGPMRYAVSIGEGGINHSLYRLVESCGERFKPDPGWSEPQRLFPPAQSGRRA